MCLYMVSSGRIRPKRTRGRHWSEIIYQKLMQDRPPRALVITASFCRSSFCTWKKGRKTSRWGNLVSPEPEGGNTRYQPTAPIQSRWSLWGLVILTPFFPSYFLPRPECHLVTRMIPIVDLVCILLFSIGLVIPQQQHHLKKQLLGCPVGG